MNIDELTLRDFPEFKAMVNEIYKKIMADEFEYLHEANLTAAGSTPSEYRNALKDLLRGMKLTEIPSTTLDEAYVFVINLESSEYSIEFPFYAGGEQSDIFGIFRTKMDNETSKPFVFLYDILVP